MSIINTIILDTIYIFFSLMVYLLYLVYAKNLDLKEKGYFLDISLYTALYLMIKYASNTYLLPSIVLLNIPLVICFLKKKTTCSVIISIILIYYLQNITTIPLYFLISEYIIYFSIYIFTTKKPNFIKIVSYFIKSLYY